MGGFAHRQPPPRPEPPRAHRGEAYVPPQSRWAEPLSEIERIEYADGSVRYKVVSASGERCLSWDFGGAVHFRWLWQARRALRAWQKSEQAHTVVNTKRIR